MAIASKSHLARLHQSQSREDVVNSYRKIGSFLFKTVWTIKDRLYQFDLEVKIGTKFSIQEYFLQVGSLVYAYGTRMFLRGCVIPGTTLGRTARATDISHIVSLPSKTMQLC
jgi:hypothetical protein